MALDRGMLARVDRRLFAEIDDNPATKMVRVPVSDAVWSSWRRYCELIDMSMGEAIAVLISAELTSVVEANGRTVSEMIEEILHKAEQRSAALDARQRELDDQTEALGRRQRALKERERMLQRLSGPNTRASVSVSVGRNEGCPCGSGLKYKRCHGRPE